jgi:hypothetical protein
LYWEDNAIFPLQSERYSTVVNHQTVKCDIINVTGCLQRRKVVLAFRSDFSLTRQMFYTANLVNSHNTLMWSTENAHAEHETTINPSECCVRYLAIGLLGPRFSETPLTRSTTLTESMKFSDTLLKRILSKQCARRQSNMSYSMGDYAQYILLVRGSNHFERKPDITTRLRFMEPYKRQCLPK